MEQLDTPLYDRDLRSQAPQDNPLYPKKRSNPHILDFLTLIAKYRLMVFTVTVLTGIAFLASTFIVRQSFSAKTTILPPEKQAMSGMLQFLTGAGAFDLMKGNENPALDLFKNILDSRSLAVEVSKDPRIHKYFSQFDTSEKSIQGSVLGCMDNQPNRNGLFDVNCTVSTKPHPTGEQIDSAKVMAAYLANTYVQELDRYNRDRLMTSARTTRMFVENEYAVRRKQLDTLYAQLQQFQESHKTISLPEQLSSTVSAAAQLGSQVQQLQMQIAVEERDLNPNSTRLQLLHAQLAEAKTQLAKYDQGGVGDYVVALKNVPELSRTLANFTREVKVSEQIESYLREQVEQEKINEQRDLPTLQVLDVAVPPDRKTSPQRALTLITGLILGFMGSLGLIAFRTYLKQVKAEPEAHRRFLNFLYAVRYGKRATFIPLATVHGTNGSDVSHATDFSTVVPGRKIISIRSIVFGRMGRKAKGPGSGGPTGGIRS